MSSTINSGGSHHQHTITTTTGTIEGRDIQSRGSLTHTYHTHDHDAPPLLEIPEEIYAVRKAALQVLKPLNKTWVRSSRL